MKVLITGFDPFGGETINPAFEAVKRLPDEIAGATVVKIEIPTVFGKDGEVLRAAIAEHRPDIVFCIGQAGGRAKISVEKVAINLIEARIPDNDGKQPLNAAIEEDGETAYFATLPVKAIVNQITAAGIPATVSYTAGTFVCNDIMYRLLYLAKTEFPSLIGGFIHVPYLPEQVVSLPDGTASMPVELMTEALRIAIETTATVDEDDQNAMGTIM